MKEELMKYLNNYESIEQISIILSTSVLVFFYFAIIFPIVIFILSKIFKLISLYGCIIKTILIVVSLTIFPLIISFSTSLLIFTFKTFSQNDLLLNFIIRQYYIAIPLSLILIILSVFIGVRVWKYFLNKIFGTRITTSRKLKKQLLQAEKHSEVISFSSNPKTLITNTYRGILVHGGAGSGKSKTFIYPILSQMISKRFSGIVYDFKSPELIEFVKNSNQSENPLKLIEVNFKNPGISDQINLLDGLQNVSEVKELGGTLWKNLNNDAIKNSNFWNSSSENLLTATMYVLIKHHPKYATVPHTLAILLSFSPDEIIDLISKDRQASGLIKSIASANELGASKQVSGTLGTLQNYISTLNTPEIFWLLSGSKMPTPNNKENPSILLLGNDSTLYETYSPVIAMIITATIRKMNKPNMLKSMVVLDELPTIFIPSLETLPATSRSNKIATIVGIQDLSQLIDKYGKEKSDIILSNLGSQFFGRSTLEKTAKYVSSLFGKYDKMMTSQTSGESSSFQSASSSSGTTKSYQERDRLKPSQILNQTAGQFSGIIADGYPREFILKQFGEYKAEIKQLKKEEKLFNVVKPTKKDVSYSQMERRFEEIYKQVELIKP